MKIEVMDKEQYLELLHIHRIKIWDASGQVVFEREHAGKPEHYEISDKDGNPLTDGTYFYETYDFFNYKHGTLILTTCDGVRYQMVYPATECTVYRPRGGNDDTNET